LTRLNDSVVLALFTVGLDVLTRNPRIFRLSYRNVCTIISMAVGHSLDRTKEKLRVQWDD